MALTDTTIKQIPNRQINLTYKLFYAHGLSFLVKPNGCKYRRLQYRRSGKQKTIAGLSP